MGERLKGEGDFPKEEVSRMEKAASSDLVRMTRGYRSSNSDPGTSGAANTLKYSWQIPLCQKPLLKHTAHKR